MKKKYRRMTVTMDDGLKIVFTKTRGKWIFAMFDGTCYYQNEVRKSSIHAVVGQPLSMTYFYGCGWTDSIKTETMVKKIEYE